jgi:deoxycytidylate deaminase
MQPLRRNWKYLREEHAVVEKSRRLSSIINICRLQASLSQGCKGQHGAVLVRGGAIIKQGYNKPSYRAFTDRFRVMVGKLLHAEMDCVLNLPRGLTEGSDIYVVRLSKAGDLVLSYPCRQCVAGLKFVGIRRVYFSVDNETIGMIKLQNS